MTIELKIKNLILSRYKSIREFTEVAHIPYSTLDSILRRGVKNASLANVILICKNLGISADELAEGRIVPLDSVPYENDSIEHIFADAKTRLVTGADLTIKNKPIADEDLVSLLDGLDFLYKMMERKYI